CGVGIPVDVFAGEAQLRAARAVVDIGRRVHRARAATAGAAHNENANDHGFVHEVPVEGTNELASGSLLRFQSHHRQHVANIVIVELDRFDGASRVVGDRVFRPVADVVVGALGEPLADGVDAVVRVARRPYGAAGVAEWHGADAVADALGGG